ncbi:MAG TPA: cupin domain-containing protein [Burkholderiales bacterium]|nr:cupin domain-containing protein [Burkholderiales bacterium]
MKKTLMTVAVLAAVAATGFYVAPLSAQQPGMKRIEVQDRDLSIPGRHAVQARAEFEPGGAVGRHTHPGEELSIVLEGTLTLEVDGQPARIVKTGESIFIPAGTVHAAKNATSGKTVVFATYIVEKGKPVASPAK